MKNAVGLLNRLSGAADGDGNIVEIFAQIAGAAGISIGDLRLRTALRTDDLQRKVDEGQTNGNIVDAGGTIINATTFKDLETATLAAIEKHHRRDTLSRGLPRETLREQIFRHAGPEIFRAVTTSLESSGRIAFDQDVFRLADHATQLSPGETQVHNRIREIYTAAGLEVPKLDDALREASAGSGLDQKAARKVFQLFINNGELVAVTTEFYFPSDVLAGLTAKLRGSGDPTIDVPKFKEIAGVSRKYAIPLLEYFDRTRVTQRVGDKRQIL
jgi:selenocysteine-specific elongation factor